MDNIEVLRNERSYKYKFSVVVAVYNAERFLDETIMSVINQDIGFEDNIQLILVEDGSPDKSGEICDKYYNEYPENIVVIHKENGGVASARNEGLKYVEGKYINFLDSDDKFALDAFKKVYSFFEKNYEYTDVVTVPRYFFGHYNGKHGYHEKYKRGSRVISLISEYKTVTMCVSSSFFKSERRHDIVFDKYLVSGEDIKVVLSILYPKLTVGVISNTKFLYRKENNSLSIISTSNLKRDWYLNYVKNFVNDICNFYINNIGYIPYFVQYTLLCDYRWRLSQKKIQEGILTNSEFTKYISDLIETFKYFDDNVVIGHNYLYRDTKLFILAEKYKTNPTLRLMPEKQLLSINNIEEWNISNALSKIEFVKIYENKIEIEGIMYIWGAYNLDKYQVCIKLNDKYINCDIIDRDVNSYFFDIKIRGAIPFKCNIEITDNNNIITLFTRVNTKLFKRNNIVLGEFCPITKDLLHSYYYNDGWALNFRNNSFNIVRCSKIRRLNKEKSLFFELIKKGKAGKKAAISRILAILIKPFIKKNILLISDRIHVAGDNGEEFFKYMVENKNTKYKPIFCIKRDSLDFERMSKIGKTISVLGWKYKFYVLLGASIVSSQGEHHFFRPFLGLNHLYSDFLVRNKFIFLQHGVTKDDLSEWLNKYNKNIALFITVTKQEYKSILNYNYHYTEKEVKLTGFCRYDNLLSHPKKVITIMPTWRSFLLGKMDIDTGIYSFPDTILSSEYYLNYNKLLSNKKIFDIADEYGYKIQFKNHPNMSSITEKFEFDDRCDVLNDSETYNNIFCTSNLIITDYSSVAFDFAYLRKPVIYFQFDKELFFSGNHTYTKGYFDYEKDGFGEVEYDLESLIDRIIEYIKNDCKLKDKYRQRIEDTFMFNDQNNCERVFKAIDEIIK